MRLTRLELKRKALPIKISSLEEQLHKLQSKYADFYDAKIIKNADGSRSLVAKRKDEAGKEIQYFYSDSPAQCDAYQQTHLDDAIPRVRLQ